MPASFVFGNADLGSGRVVDVRVQGGRVDAITVPSPRAEEDYFDCGGGALLPGLHDHHAHLLATAAAVQSVRCDAPAVRTSDDFRAVLRAATPRDGWIRAIGYDEGIYPRLDRDALDGIRLDVAIRVQHRSGALWVMNSAGLTALAVENQVMEGLERDPSGRPTGRFWRMDDWLRDRLPTAVPDLSEVGRRLSAYGITGITDATPRLNEDAVRMLASDVLPQHVTMLGDPGGSAPWKIVIADHSLPTPDDVRVAVVKVRPRPVALHCVTRAALVTALVALEAAGCVRGDRIEHAAVCPPALAATIARLNVTVVTQPALATERGDDYLDRVDAEDVPHLWPYASLLAAGVHVGCSSDAPYGPLDPWQTIAAARDRCTPSGRTIGEMEKVPADQGLRGFLTPPGAPGGPVRGVCVGRPADLVALDRPRSLMLYAPTAEAVQLTMIGGRAVYRAEAATFE